MDSTRLDASLAIDGRKLDALRSAASRDPAGQAKAAAQQFEAVFTSLLMKSMREALPKSGLTAGEGAKVFEGLLDQQRAQAIAARGGLGLASVIERQLLRHIPRIPGRIEVGQLDLAKGALNAAASVAHATPQTFVERLREHAANAARAIGVPTAFVLGQAALESGWGKREIGADQGVRSHNLFGIKAGAGWKGASVEIPTTEYIDGVARTVCARFRAYSSYAEAFADYAKLIAGSRRYSEAAAAGSDVQAFAQGLRKGGYATDPRYAEKLAATIARASRA